MDPPPSLPLVPPTHLSIASKTKRPPTDLLALFQQPTPKKRRISPDWQNPVVLRLPFVNNKEACEAKTSGHKRNRQDFFDQCSSLTKRPKKAHWLSPSFPSWSPFSSPSLLPVPNATGEEFGEEKKDCDDKMDDRSPINTIDMLLPPVHLPLPLMVGRDCFNNHNINSNINSNRQELLTNQLNFRPSHQPCYSHHPSQMDTFQTTNQNQPPLQHRVHQPQPFRPSQPAITSSSPSSLVSSHLQQQQQQQQPQCRLLVKTLNGKTLRFTVSPTDNVTSVKAVVAMRYGIPMERQRLIYAGKEMTDERVFGDYSIKNDSVLHLVWRLSGNAFDSQLY